MHEATIYMSISASSCQVIYLFIVIIPPCGNASYYLVRATIFLALLELCSGIMNVSMRNPTGTPADGDKGSVEGRYVEYYPIQMTNATLANSQSLGYMKYQPRASIFTHDITFKNIAAVDSIQPV